MVSAAAHMGQKAQLFLAPTTSSPLGTHTILLQKERKLRHQPLLSHCPLVRRLAALVQPTGHEAWVINYSVRGRPRWLTLGPAFAFPVAEARRRAASLLGQVADGKDPQAEKMDRKRSDTFAELASRYLEEHAKRRLKSWEQQDYLL